MKLFVLHESGKLVGVFSSPELLADHVALNTMIPEFIGGPDGYYAMDRCADYSVKVVNLDEPRTDA